MPPFISREDARRIEEAQRRRARQTAFGGDAATTASPEALAAWERSLAGYEAAGGGQRQRLDDQTRTAAYDPGADMFDPRNMRPVDLQGNTLWTVDYPSTPQTSGGTPATKITSSGSLGSRVVRALEGLPLPEEPPPVTSAELLPYPNPGSTMPGYGLPDYQRTGYGTPRLRYSPQELGVGSPADVPTAAARGEPGGGPAVAGVVPSAAIKAASGLTKLGVPRESLRGPLSAMLRAMIPDLSMPRGGATFGGNRFGGNTFGGNRFGGNTAADIRGALDRTNQRVQDWNGQVYARGGPIGYARGGYPQLRTAPVRSAFSTGGGENYVGSDGQGDGRSDHIEAVLSPGEYVMDAETVSLLGDGDNEAGARAFDQMRENIRRHKGAKLAKGEISSDAKEPEQYLAKARGGRIKRPKMVKAPKPATPDPKMNLSAADLLARDPYGGTREPYSFGKDK